MIILWPVDHGQIKSSKGQVPSATASNESLLLIQGTSCILLSYLFRIGTRTPLQAKYPANSKLDCAKMTHTGTRIEDCAKDRAEEFFNEMHCARITNLEPFYRNSIKARSASR